MKNCVTNSQIIHVGYLWYQYLHSMSWSNGWNSLQIWSSNVYVLICSFLFHLIQSVQQLVKLVIIFRNSNLVCERGHPESPTAPPTTVQVPLFYRIPACHVTVFYYLGFACLGLKKSTNHLFLSWNNFNYRGSVCNYYTMFVMWWMLWLQVSEAASNQASTLEFALVTQFLTWFDVVQHYRQLYLICLRRVVSINLKLPNSNIWVAPFFAQHVLHVLLQVH